jgi:adenylosuccinate synthase
MKRARAVIGASFGDEGKGLTVDYLCGKGDVGVVVRYSGGAQAGHTVVTPEGERHVFRTVGSGAFHGVPTFLSSFVSVNPIALFLELQQLDKLGVRPELFASPQCLVTTFADVIINRRLEDARGAGRHGSCGLGISETIERSRIPELSITMADVFNGGAGLETKLAEICDRYASFRTGKPIDEPKMAEGFLRACKELPRAVFPAGIGQCKDPCFEGSQGLLLDMGNAEYFPHVTRSHTGLKNVMELCAQAGIERVEPYYVTRTYLTRHGAGPLPGEDVGLSYPDDTNGENHYQGRLRFAPLDAPALHQRVGTDALPAKNYRLVVTHRDQLERPDVLGTLSAWGPTRSDVRGKFEGVAVA